MPHDPVPWDVQNKGVLGERSARHEVVRGVNLDGSKNLPTIVRMRDLSDRSYANARFIVQACNAHEDLVEALEGLLATEDDPTDSCQWCGNFLKEDAAHCRVPDCPGVMAHAAIAQATSPQAG